MDVVPDGGESELELMRRWGIKEPEEYADLPPILALRTWSWTILRPGGGSIAANRPGSVIRLGVQNTSP